MTQKKIAPYGTWKSPIIPELITEHVTRLSDLRVDGQNLYWTETRPQEAGRSVVVRKNIGSGETTDMTPPSFNARTRVHEYGGAPFCVSGDIVYFSNFSDGYLYKLKDGDDPTVLTSTPGLRFADMFIDEVGAHIIAVCEDHREKGEAKNSIVSISLKDGEVIVLADDADFYASPRVSPEGRYLAYVKWNHPNMPWDATRLEVIDIQSPVHRKTLEVGDGTESVIEPLFSPEGTLVYVSDRNGWWNLYQDEHAVYPLAAEFTDPAWTFGMSHYGFTNTGGIVATYSQDGSNYLALIDRENGLIKTFDLPYTVISQVRVENGDVFFIAGSSKESMAIVRLNLATTKIEVLMRTAEVAIDAEYLSIPQPIEFPTEGGLTAHGLLYLPHNKDFSAPNEELPPCIVKIHGGPTSSTNSALNLGIQFWTSRGFAVFDVNYGGSAGYGRDYRKRLYGNWGVVDVKDCVNGVKYLVHEGLVDSGRLIITGGSAGGYTALAALTFEDVFATGASHYGISDLMSLASDTHKFESRYLDQMVGSLPEARAMLQERSPVNYAHQINCPIIFFQGSEDVVVPPSQTERIVSALREKGVPVAYMLFAGEQHGFRGKDAIHASLAAELYFYGAVLGFKPDLPPPSALIIENLG